VTKWIHLNWGDEGLITLFVKIWRLLRPVCAALFAGFSKLHINGKRFFFLIFAVESLVFAGWSFYHGASTLDFIQEKQIGFRGWFF
jgi:hypothetical protein